MASRGSNDPPLSLFSFQDIVTSVTGVMVLLTLLMAVELIQRVAASPKEQTTRRIETTSQSLAEMRAEIDALQNSLGQIGRLPVNLPTLDPQLIQSEIENLNQGVDRLQGELSDLSRDLHSRRAALGDSESVTAAEKPQQEQEIAKLEQQIASDQQRLEEMKTSNAVYFSKGAESKRVWLVELPGAGPIAAELGVSAVPQKFKSVAEMTKWAGRQSATGAAFYVIVKPAGAPFLEEMRDALQAAGFDVGFHVAAADQQIIHPTTGASPP